MQAEPYGRNSVERVPGSIEPDAPLARLLLVLYEFRDGNTQHLGKSCKAGERQILLPVFDALEVLVIESRQPGRFLLGQAALGSQFSHPPTYELQQPPVLHGPAG